MQPQLKTLFRRLALACLLALALPLAFLSASTGHNAWIEHTLGSQIERELGYRHFTPTIEVLDSPRKVIAVKSITPGGLFARSGIRPNDILLLTSSLSNFYLELDSSRGKTITLVTVSGGDGTRPNGRPSRVIRFIMPGRPRDKNRTP